MTNFQELYSAERFRGQAHRLVDLLADHLRESSSGEAGTIPHAAPETTLQYWQADFEKPTLQDVNILFEDILAHSIRLHSPRYLGHQVSVPLPAAAMAAMLESLLNNSGAVHEMGMVISSLEKILTNWFSQKIGFPDDSYGIVTSGGTLANLTALLTARALKAPEDVWTLGAQTRLAVMVSEEAHYCIDRAARIMGLGEKGVIKVPVNERFQMRVELLDALLAEAKAEGLHVFAIVGSACSTATGSFDNLEAIADFAEKHGIWMHVDGAHGGAAILSEKYKYLLRGIARADSAIVDFHKMMMIPSLSTGVFYRNSSDSFHTFATKASYLFASQDEDWYNTGKRTFECTKPGTILRLYSVLRSHGEQVFGDAVERLFDLGKTFADMIRRNPAFELAVDPETNIVCFRYVGNWSQDLDGLNRRIRQNLVEKGRFYLVSTVMNGAQYLRVSLMNPLTTEKDLAELLETISQISYASFPAIMDFNSVNSA
jgi:L-2,4-diaminobutyrate decarboxylase